MDAALQYTSGVGGYVTDMILPAGRPQRLAVICQKASMNKWVDGCLLSNLPRFLPGLEFLGSGVQEPGEITIPGTAG